MLIDTSATCRGGQFLPLPIALAECLGGTWHQEAYLARYALPARVGAIPGTLQGVGPLAVGQFCRRVEVGDSALVWLHGISYDDTAVPEDLGPLGAGNDPLVWATSVGDGVAVCATMGLGELIMSVGHPDYAALLEAMVTHGSLTPPNLLIDAPSSVEVTLMHWRDGVVVHLVNGAGPALLDNPIPIGPITLSLAWDGPALADLCLPGASVQPLSCEEMWNRVRIVIPRLDVYAQVVVRSA